MKRVLIFIGLLSSACAVVAPRVPVASRDQAVVSHGGEDIPSLEPHLAAGKVTVVDFYAEWCGPCREVDTYVQGLLAKRSDVAFRKINIGDWDTPVAKRYLSKVPTLPYVIIYGRDGKVVRDISGLDLDALDAAVIEGSRR